MKKQTKLGFLAVALAATALSACGGSGEKTQRSKKSREAESIYVEPKPTLKIGDGEAEVVEFGTPITKPADPQVPAGKVFLGWKNVKNGGQIWNFESEVANKVMEPVELQPCFVNAGLNTSVFEAECSPTITEGIAGMHGATYSGGADGKQLIGIDRANTYGATSVSSIEFYKSPEGALELDDPTHEAYPEAERITINNTFGAFVHFNYNKGNTIIFTFNSNKAVANATVVGRFSAEYGLNRKGVDFNELTSTVTETSFPVKVNGTAIQYGKVTIHNIVDQSYVPFQDFVLGEVALREGTNTIELIVDNEDTLNGTIASSSPVIDSIKVMSDATLTWTNCKATNLIDDTTYNIK